MIAEVTRVRKLGRSLYVLLSVPIIEHTCWHNGDAIVARPDGNKIILERIDLAGLARIPHSEHASDEL